MKIKFWGVRGSIPVSGESFTQFGGNTTCIQVVTDDNEVIIIDSGTGIRALGNDLMQSEFSKGQGKASLLFTHTHWDHIQGFPFFTPFFIGKRDPLGNKIKNISN
ncbi:MBL fold metallo-hydrolase, partial [Candidatus Desantisbacteria bacterium]|nr:MBL fold metallo-hydrolase [Candidatus Desantisbacteria bacterium]